ncbi:MAG: phosphoadenosine phosphosulfate reductase family protein [Victivallales bacterium]|jgi:3'-phosphoadenosine 5'-phosphosulfate sulfotransferase (PAPS reductase)/FAD synthetase
MLLGNYSSIVISISGGKDSQTILGVVLGMAREQQYAGLITAIHADTGAEWPQSLPHCQMLCNHYGIKLHVAVPHRALPQHIERRCSMMAIQQPRGKPGWPSPAQRYCTSDCKRAPIQKIIRMEFPAGCGKTVLSVSGERRQESRNRVKLPWLEEDKPLCVKGRTVMRWHPILDYTLDDVWTHIKSTGLPRHIAYDKGNERLSCAICVLATDSDIRNGAKECPGLADHYLRIESEYGFTFKHKKSLSEILAGART